ncbi:MAG: beta-N-acetylglucosaminidase domain-containing protein [Mucinivorans sp.]
MRKLFLVVFLSLSAVVVWGAEIFPTPRNVAYGPAMVKYNEKSIKTITDTTIAAEGYRLNVSRRGISIASSTPRGEFYARVTLAQLIENNMVQEVSVDDSPVVRFRGVVEGFYGKPWSHRDRLAQFVFYGQNKLNTYIYGPKDDPYHSAQWRTPYPKQQAAQIAELARVAAANQVDFVWAIHPGGSIKWTEEDFQILLHKFNLMYDLGVRSYAIFFDDISGEGTNPHRQAELLNRLNSDFVEAKGDVTPLIMCPTEYNKSWANPDMEKGYLAILGRELDKNVQIMWTGDRVCADITTQTLDWINARIKREAYIWWNFPVTDYIPYMVLQGPSYGLTPQTPGRMSGFASNPMENAEASKIALFGVADYTWNPEKYNPLAAWQEAIKRIMPQAAQAYRTFAIHSADMGPNGHGYRRDESWETSFTDPGKLRADFADLSKVEQTILNSGADSALVGELRPWLTVATVVGQKGLHTLDMLDVASRNDLRAMWFGYLDSEMNDQEALAYKAHRLGTLRLMPWIEAKRDSVARVLYSALGGSLAESPNAKAKIYTNIDRLSSQEVTSAAGRVALAPVMEQVKIEKGQYFGIEFPSPMTIRNIDSRIIVGSNLTRQLSVDGENWTEKALPQVRYIRYINLKDKAPSMRLEKFEVDCMPLSDNLAALTDGDLRSAYTLSGTMTIQVPYGAKQVIVLGQNDARAEIEGMCNAEGLSFFVQEIPEGTKTVTLSKATGQIREIIWKIDK